MQSYRLYAGAYTDGKPGDGVYFLDFDADGLRAAQVCGGVVNTSYVLPEGGRLYAVEEVDRAASVLEFEPAAGTSFRRWAVPGSGLCHIASNGPFLYASGYAGGTLTGLRKSDGAVCSFLRHEGHSVHPLRQTQAHVHSALPPCGGSRHGSPVSVRDRPGRRAGTARSAALDSGAARAGAAAFCVSPQWGVAVFGGRAQTVAVRLPQCARRAGAYRGVHAAAGRRSRGFTCGGRSCDAGRQFCLRLCARGGLPLLLPDPRARQSFGKSRPVFERRVLSAQLRHQPGRPVYRGRQSNAGQCDGFSERHAHRRAGSAGCRAGASAGGLCEMGALSRRHFRIRRFRRHEKEPSVLPKVLFLYGWQTAGNHGGIGYRRDSRTSSASAAGLRQNARQKGCRENALREIFVFRSKLHRARGVRKACMYQGKVKKGSIKMKN